MSLLSLWDSLIVFRVSHLSFLEVKFKPNSRNVSEFDFVNNYWNFDTSKKYFFQNFGKIRNNLTYAKTVHVLWYFFKNQRITQHLVRMFFLGGRDARGNLLQKRNFKIENKAILEVFNCPKWEKNSKNC